MPFLQCWIPSSAGSVRVIRRVLPEQDYIPLLALLARRLTNEEVAAVATELGRQGAPIYHADIGTLITKVTNEVPRNEDVARVRDQLATAGPFI